MIFIYESLEELLDRAFYYFKEITRILLDAFYYLDKDKPLLSILRGIFLIDIFLKAMIFFPWIKSCLGD